ncbi:MULTISPECIES: thioesterase II family protein [unclassified Xanthobacter]|uniref:thioesterase II family protein n=1 Tax=unclassified Xanthobacter TaxID=2623496 RepID=UPI001EDDF8BB|nr:MULTISPECIES: thioesterase domain-containing protein [unclassified Xanthobacter]
MSACDSPPLLLALPPAGVGPSLFRGWARPGRSMNIHPVALPGREVRFNDPLPASLDALADQMAEELQARLTGRYAIFGYSMGALLGYEIARRWVRWGLPGPDMLFVLGCNAPDRMVLDREPFHTLAPHDFQRTLADLGGIHMDILNNPEAMAVFEPILRNDFRICEVYQHDTSGDRLDCPAHVFHADADAFVQWEAACAWSEFITGTTMMHTVEGRHMIAKSVFDALPDTLERLWLHTRTPPNVAAMPAC